jgi:SAM-dependent methyltransferase
MRATRRRVAERYVQGNGLEIGALHRPLGLPAGAHARYVDRLDIDGLRHHYPELARLPLVTVDIVADGETLDGVADESQEFIVANHFLEHTQDPIGALKSHLRVLAAGGILYLAIPDKRHSFDSRRPLTSVVHLEEDHRDGGRATRAGHYLEWATLVDSVPDPSAHAEALDQADYSIHFHVWTAETFRMTLDTVIAAHELPCRIETTAMNHTEFIVIIRRT